MVCPGCGAESAKRGRVYGKLRFSVRIMDEDCYIYFPRPKGSVAHVIRSPGCMDLGWAAPTRLTAEASFCDRCQWMDIDCTDVVLHRDPRHRCGSFLDFLVSPNPLEMPEPQITDTPCPECGGAMGDGYVFTDLLFLADGERPGCWSRFWLWLRRATEARASARCCRACGWVEVDCATFVEPPPIPVYDRIQHH